LIGAGISALALPFLALSRRQNAPADTVEVADAETAAPPSEAASITTRGAIGKEDEPLP
jgi:hypothetical protein